MEKIVLFNHFAFPIRYNKREKIGDQSERKADMIWRKEKKRDQSNKKSGEEAGEVMESFITRWYPDILRYCVWHAPNMSAAEDAAQETFLKLIRYYKEEVEKGKNLRSLLYRIASGVCIDMWRKKSVSEVSLDALAEYTSSSDCPVTSAFRIKLSEKRTRARTRNGK